MSSTPQESSKARVYFVSLGCPKNLVDSQVMLGLLARDRYVITRNPEEAEVIIVNTCSFIEASKEESIEMILELAEQNNPDDARSWSRRAACRSVIPSSWKKRCPRSIYSSEPVSTSA